MRGQLMFVRKTWKNSWKKEDYGDVGKPPWTTARPDNSSQEKYFPYSIFNSRGVAAPAAKLSRRARGHRNSGVQWKRRSGRHTVYESIKIDRGSRLFSICVTINAYRSYKRLTRWLQQAKTRRTTTRKIGKKRNDKE